MITTIASVFQLRHCWPLLPALMHIVAVGIWNTPPHLSIL